MDEREDAPPVMGECFVCGSGGEEGAGRRCRLRTPDGMRVRRTRTIPGIAVRATMGEQGRFEAIRGRFVVEDKKEGTEVLEEDVSMLPRIVLVEKVNAGKGELSKVQEDYFGVMMSLKLTQKEVDRSTGEISERNVSVDSLRERLNPLKRGGKGQGSKEMARRRKYEI
eukprot:gb/GEZJ01001853.1/.p1 GENE.gb/GEZJ01001853.1/~~gb/GEZJ01001853.1/.p1  ORF type:complete len:168 (-),score=23.81 gb/GEZJ01001853.1/:1948-2451(-)